MARTSFPVLALPVMLALLRSVWASILAQSQGSSFLQVRQKSQAVVVRPAPPIFVNIGDAMGKRSHVAAWKIQSCRRRTFPCSFPLEMDVCRDTFGCSTHLKAALLQAKEFNPDVLLVEEGGMCETWCAANGIGYQAIPGSLMEKTFCKVYEASEQMLQRVPERLESVFLTAVLRWPLLNEFLQGHVEGSVTPPERFALVDHDMMVYTSTAKFFSRFGDTEAAVCTSQLYPFQTNGVLSLFTKDSFNDFVEFYYSLMPMFEGPCCNDMDVLKYYSGTFQSFMPKNPSRLPRFAVNNSCLPFGDGRVSENVVSETKEGKRELFFQDAALHFKPAADAPFSLGGPERVFGTHFQGGNKVYMPWAFRPDLGRVVDAGCRSCLLEDCTCSGPDCKGCWQRCSKLPGCSILRTFEAKVFHGGREALEAMLMSG